MGRDSLGLGGVDLVEVACTRMTNRLLDDLGDPGELGLIARGALTEHTVRRCSGDRKAQTAVGPDGVHYHQVFQLVAVQP